MYRASPFSRFAKWTARAAGHPAAFALAVLIILGWAVLGPLYQFSDTWQLVINTGTTIVTFLMVFPLLRVTPWFALMPWPEWPRKRFVQ